MFYRRLVTNSADQQSGDPDDHMTDVIGIRHISGHQHLTTAHREVQASQDPGEDLQFEKTARVNNRLNNTLASTENL